MQPPPSSQGDLMPSFLTMDLDSVTIRPEGNVAITVHRVVLSAVSSYSQNAFDGPFIEAKQHTIALPDVSEPTFRAFLQWANIKIFRSRPAVKVLCKESLLPTTAGTPSTRGTSPTVANLYQISYDTSHNGDYGFDERNFHPEPEHIEELRERFYTNQDWLANYRRIFLSIVQLYVFADRYKVPQLRDDVLTACLELCHAMYCTEAETLPSDALLPPAKVARLFKAVDELNTEKSADGDEHADENENEQEDDDDEMSGAGAEPAFDERQVPTMAEKALEVFCADATWIRNATRFNMSIAKLFLFADWY
ncbi:hypothetical protein E8E11_008425 [Didymella keratinophila]|nr:hypothetical protein E8E11_008425 [Didymella keratinophila]